MGAGAPKKREASHVPHVISQKPNMKGFRHMPHFLYSSQLCCPAPSLVFLVWTKEAGQREGGTEGRAVVAGL